jgi:hypothetical protein
MADKAHRIRGREYEMVLEAWLRRNGVAFKGEEDLRREGYSKTPDFLLDIPHVVDGRLVNWIESKALFGDARTHERYVRDQIQSYRTRYGPGVVIYWFGYAADILQDPEVLVLTSVPPKMTCATLH